MLAGCIVPVFPQTATAVVGAPQVPVSPTEEAKLRARLAAEPGDAESARALAGLLERSGRTRAALAVRRELVARTQAPQALSRVRLGLAVALIDAGKNEEAIPLLRVVVSDEPAEELAQFELGTALANQEQFESALVPFKAATVLRPDDAEAQLSTAKALVTLLRYAEAVPYLAAATRAGRTGADVATVQGMIASHTGRPSLAATAFSEAVALNPNDAEAQLRLGEALRSEGRTAEAIEALKRSTTLKPGVSALFLLARSYRDLGRTAEEHEASASLKLLESQRAEQTRVDALLAEAGRDLAGKQYARAATVYQAALALQPKDADLLYHLALVQGQMGELQRSKEHLIEALALSPRLPGALAQLGMLETVSGNSAAAKEHLSQAVAIDPQQPDALGTLGVLAARAGDLASAGALLRDALESDPASAEWSRDLGLVLAQQGDPRGAELALLRSRSLAPEQVQTELALGEFYLGAKNLTAAISSFRHATRLDPQASIGFVGLAQALYFAGDLAAGAEAERRGLEIIPDLTERQQRKRELCQSLADSHAPADSRSACETLQVNDTLRTPGRD